MPRERFSGVPDYYLLHVTNQLAAREDADTRACRMKFNGSHRLRQRYPVAARLVMAEQVTLEAWINPAGDGSDGRGHHPQQGRRVRGGPAERRDDRLRVRRPGRRRAGSGTARATIAPLDEWTHVAVVFDQGTVTTYINGVEENVQTLSFSSLGDYDALHNEFRIGGGHVATRTTRCSTAASTRPRVWNTARTATEIADTYNRVLEGDETGLQGYWRFEDQTDADLLRNGDQVRDLSPNLAHGTLQRHARRRTSVPLADRGGTDRSDRSLWAGRVSHQVRRHPGRDPARLRGRSQPDVTRRWNSPASR